MEAGDELALGLGQVEGRAVSLGQRADEVDEERHEGGRVVEEEPLPGQPALRADDALRGHGAGQQDRDHQGHAGRDLVGDDLRRAADGAEERPLRVRRPSAHDDADHDQRGDRDDVEDADVHVRHHQRVAEGQRDEHAGEAHHHEVGRDAEEELVRLLGDQVLLEQQLHRVGHPLQKAAGAHAVGAHPALDARGHPALRPGEDPGGDGGEVDHDERGRAHAGQVDELRPGPGGGIVSGVPDQVVEESLHQRSISGATTSRDAISATRSAIIRPRESTSMMPMAVKLPVRIFTRCAFSPAPATT